jgi:hypothetical protein
MKTLKNTVAALILVAFTGTSLFAQQAKSAKGKKDEKKGGGATMSSKKGKGDKKDMAVKGEGVSSKTKATAPTTPTSTSK